MLRSNLECRAKVLQEIRQFFRERGVLEVETPLLQLSTNPAPFLCSFQVGNQYLQTSPEFAMKRLLAEGSGDIYQICKAFRDEEVGAIHNPEFTILEWYRLGFTQHQLMDEVAELFEVFFPKVPVIRYSYCEIFDKILQLDPLTVELKQLEQIGAQYQLVFEGFTKDQWLQSMFTLLIEPALNKNIVTLIYDFPKEQAMLARLNPDNPELAARFEVYFRHLEMGNGFHELSSTQEQRRRFEEDNQVRLALGLPIIPLDELFLTCLDNLPDCSGIAIGVDRLLLAVCEESNLDDFLLR